MDRDSYSVINNAAFAIRELLSLVDPKCDNDLAIITRAEIIERECQGALQRAIDALKKEKEMAAYIKVLRKGI